MSDEADETDELDANGDTGPIVKYKDPYTFLCSTRWRTCFNIFFSFTLLYMHRVNLSLAVVCMVDTTGTRTPSVHNNNSETETNHSVKQHMNGSEYGHLDTQNNVTSSNITSYFLNDGVRYDVKNDISAGRIQTETINQCASVISEENKDWTPELQWKKSQISILLSSYFYGSFFTQIPAGTIADIFGGKHIITAAMLLTTICSLVTPVCARTSIILMFVVRILIGLAGGSVIPAGMSMINAWSTPNERPLMIAVCASGLLSGAIVTYLTSGLLCAYGFDNGWPSIFYIHGGITALFTCLWFLQVYSHPSHHPRISVAERDHIQTSKGHAAKIKRPKTPWKRLILSKALWATIITHFCFNWSFFTVLINVPLFLKEVLKYDVKSNGLFSAVPYIFQIITSLFSGKLSGIIIKKRIIGHLATRRLFTSISLLGIAVCLVCAGYVSCEVRHVAVILLCLSCAFAGVAYGGFFANHAEYAGQFAGTAFGITNAAGVISSILASMMAGLLTPNRHEKTNIVHFQPVWIQMILNKHIMLVFSWGGSFHGLQEEWQQVLYIAAGVNVTGAIVFALCSEVHLQRWAWNEKALSIRVGSTPEPQETRTSNKENPQLDTNLHLQEMMQLNPENNSDKAIEIEEMRPLNNEEGASIRKSPEKQETMPLEQETSIHKSLEIQETTPLEEETSIHKSLEKQETIPLKEETSIHKSPEIQETMPLEDETSIHKSLEIQDTMPLEDETSIHKPLEIQETTPFFESKTS